jgi:hypothetical protein
MEYRWGSTGAWTHLSYLDIIPFSGHIDISDATSLKLNLRFLDCGWIIDGVATAWYFGYEPFLSAHFE